MKCILKFLLNFIILFIIFSCTDANNANLFDQIATNNIIPDKKTKPEIKYFENENVMTLEWEKDEGAEEYILYRSTDVNGGFGEVYRGDKCEYEDSDVINENFYYYKLAKKRGQKEFDKSDYVLGVSGPVKRDNCEKNNKRDDAFHFDISTIGSSLAANIYFYRDSYGNTFEDIDWYYSIVPPRKTLILKIQKPLGGNLVSGDDLWISIDGGAKTSVIFSTGNYQLNNYSYSPSKIYFCIYVNKEAFINGEPSGVGGKLGAYRIDFHSLIDVDEEE